MATKLEERLMLMVEGFHDPALFKQIAKRMTDAYEAGYEAEFESAKHEYPADKDERDCYEMGVAKCRDEVRMERMRHG